MGWFINPTYSFYFIGGVSAYLLHKNYKDRQVQFIFLVSVVFGYFTALNQAENFIVDVTQQNRIVAGVVVIAFYVFFALMAKGYFNIKKTPLLIMLGSMSYPLYLIHNKAGKQIYESLSVSISSVFAIAVAVFAVLCVSFCVVFIEKKIVELIGNHK